MSALMINSVRAGDLAPLEGEFDALAFRRTLGKFATGVTVVSACAETEGRRELIGLTVNSFASVSLDPPLVLWSCKKSNPNLQLLLTAGHFAINVLSERQGQLCGHFAQPRPDRFDGVAHYAGLGGAPLLPDAAATFECALHSVVDGGDHVIIVGQVSRFASFEAAPLVFYAGAQWALAPQQAAAVA